jgi:hypothetical protein
VSHAIAWFALLPFIWAVILSSEYSNRSRSGVQALSHEYLIAPPEARSVDGPTRREQSPSRETSHCYNVALMVGGDHMNFQSLNREATHCYVYINGLLAEIEQLSIAHTRDASNLLLEFAFSPIRNRPSSHTNSAASNALLQNKPFPLS